MALFTTYYNFVRIHKTLRVTPAMAAGVTDKLWEIGNIVGVLEAWEFQQTQAQRERWRRRAGSAAESLALIAC